jgi:hypothetical protein
MSERASTVEYCLLTNERVCVGGAHERLQESVDAVRDVHAVICRRFVWFRPAVVVVVDFLTEHVQAMDLGATSAAH